MNEHEVSRPLWSCGTCHSDWPCEPAQKMIGDLHTGDDESLVRHVARLMGQAADDLGPANPTKLYKRFLGWTPVAGHACRVCGKLGHDAVPGVPPRMVPCDGRAIEPVRPADRSR
jgi:hypothetical protein